MSFAVRSRHDASRNCPLRLGRLPQVFARLSLASLIVIAASACQRTGPESVKYEPGRFDIDWTGYSKSSRSVRESLDQSFKEDIRELVAEMGKPHVQNALRAANSRPAPRNDYEILKLEEQWARSSPTSAFVSERIDRYCSLELQAFQRENPEFVEIFVTNNAGLNVCQTNKTTDYYQADEDWWQEAMEKMRPNHGQLTFDHSANTKAVPVYIPVLDRDGSGALGVAKAVIRRGSTTAD